MSLGLLCAISGAASATTTIEPKTKKPSFDFQFPSTSGIASGTRTPLPRGGRTGIDGSSAASGRVATSRLGARFVINGTSALSARAHAWVEDVVEQVHDQVRDVDTFCRD